MDEIELNDVRKQLCNSEFTSSDLWNHLLLYEPDVNLHWHVIHARV